MTDGRDGLVLGDPENPIELAAAIEKLAEPARHRLWETAARQNAERFTYSRQIDHLIALSPAPSLCG